METVTTFHRGWRRHAAFAVIFALFFHAALLLAHRPASADPGAAAGGTVVLCTSLGLKVVALADLQGGSLPSDKSDKSTIAYCPICLSAQLAGTFVAPAAVLLPQPRFVGKTVVVAQRSETGPFAAPVSGLGPRAPPFFV